MRAVIYTRASFDRTGEGKSNSRQEQECVRLCEYKRWDIIAREGDQSISAYGEKERPGWLRVLAMVESGEVDVVVAWHLDRLTRNMADLEKLIVLCEKHNVSVATATGDIDLTHDTGRMVARILAAVARQEVERKAARQRLAHAQRRKEGRPWAAVKMLGYDRDGTIIEKEAKAIREAIDQVLNEDFSLAEIARHWTELELRSPYQAIRDEETGEVVDWKPWSRRGVRGVLTNPRLAGLVVHNGEVLGKGEWEPIVDETSLTLVVAKMSTQERYVGGGSKTGRIAQNLLTGIATCWKCGGTVRAGSKRGVATYFCNEWHVTVPREQADELVRSSFAAAVALASPGAILSATKGTVDAEAAGEELIRVRGRKEVLVRTYTAGHLDEEMFEDAIRDLNEQIEALEAKVTSGGGGIDWMGARAESVRRFLSQDVSEQRKVLERLATITLHPAKGSIDARRQVEVIVKARRGETDIEIPAHVPEAV